MTTEPFPPYVGPTNIYDDPRTVRADMISAWARARNLYWDIGHYFRAWDEHVYRVIGYREADGPWIQEVLGRSETRTISLGALGRTFHHYKACPVKDCGMSNVGFYGVREPRSLVWCGCEQSSDGTTLWINDSKGHCIGRLSPRGIDVHNTVSGQEKTGEQCLFCEKGDIDSKFVTIEQYVRFEAEMKKHHGVNISSSTGLRLRHVERLVEAPA